MKIKLDENLPGRLSNILADLGHDVDTALEEGLKGSPDSRVWRAAQKARRFLITQDLDFSDIRRFKPVSHCGLLILRMKEPGRTALSNRIYDIFKNHEVENWVGSFIVVTDWKIRVLPPKNSL